MPYGHIRQYRDLVKEVQNKRIKITRRQQEQIAKLYRDLAKEIGKDISGKDQKTLSYRWLKDYAKSLKVQSRQIYNDLQGIVSLGISDTAKAVSEAESAFWASVAPNLAETFRDTFSTIPQSCVDELMTGGIYKDFVGLSERLWNYKKKFDQDIGFIINRGMIEQKSAYDLAKDLELYVKPGAKKPWEWRKVYPGCNLVVDYNAQRLARTSVTHAYQMSFQRSTRDNPFIESYKWNSSNSTRMCDLCRSRDGKIFPKNKVPLDHPNGMCVITAVIPKTMDEIAEELSEWASGKSNKALDRWLGRKRLGTSSGASSGRSRKSRIGEIDYAKTPAAIKYFEDQIRRQDTEKAIVVDKDGIVYQFDGGESSVDIYDVDLSDAYVTHNHPSSQGIVSFGEDDFYFMREHSDMKEFRCCNEEYEYVVKVLRPLDEVVYNNIYLEGFKYQGEEDFEAQDAAFRVLQEKGYIEYEKRRLSD